MKDILQRTIVNISTIEVISLPIDIDLRFGVWNATWGTIEANRNRL